MRMLSRSGLYKGLMAAALGLAMSSFVGITFAATPADTLVIGKASDPQTLDPAVTMDNNDWTVVYPAYQRLLGYKHKDGKGSTEVEGDLATDWDVSEDNLTWTFHLREGQKFADGSAVDAAAVKQSFERLMHMGQGPSGAFPEDMRIRAPDDLTVKFVLKTAYAPFLSTLANNGAAVINPKVLARDDANQWLAGHTAGSGPYQLESWHKGQAINMIRNPHYAGTKKPVLEKFVVKIIPESSAQRLQLEKGDLDIATRLSVDQLDALKKASHVHVAEFPSLRVTYLYLNNARAPLDNVTLRHAVVDAMDYKGIVDGVMKGQVKQTRGPIPEGMWGYDEDLPLPVQDMAKAKQEVQQAGGVDKPLLLRYSDATGANEAIALTTQATLGEAGIKVKLERLANATLRENLDKGNFDISIGTWGPDFADPYMFTNYWFDSSKGGLAGNRSFYDNTQVDKWLAEAVRVNDQDERIKLYDKVQRQAIKDAAYVYLFQNNYQVGIADNVEGFVYNPMQDDVFNVADMRKK